MIAWAEWEKRTDLLGQMIVDLTERQWALAAKQSRLTQEQGALADETNKLRPALIAHLRQRPQQKSGETLQPSHR